MERLTKRQHQILDFIVQKTRRHGKTPTFREIGRRFRISSTNGVRDHLLALERKGAIRLAGRRGIELPHEFISHLMGLPRLGRIAAGKPIMTEENFEGILDMRSFFGSHDETFVLEVKGDSMIDAGIADGDLVVVHHQPEVEDGDIAVAFIDGEATVKRLYDEPHRWRLQPQNKNMKPIYVSKEDQSFRIAGKVVGLLRRLRR